MSETVALRVAPGDTVVLKCDQALSHEVLTRMEAQMQSLFPENRVVVLGRGMDLHVLGDNERLARIERQLDQLIAALAEDDETVSSEAKTLDGESYVAREREAGTPL